MVVNLNGGSSVWPAPAAGALPHGSWAPTAESTLRSYKRNGNMPVPDFQLGGRDPAPGEKIKCWAKGPRERDPQPGERIGSVNRWRASTIIAWNDTRKGGGFWRENQTTDGSTTPQPATDTRTPRKVKRAQDQK